MTKNTGKIKIDRKEIFFFQESCKHNFVFQSKRGYTLTFYVDYRFHVKKEMTIDDLAEGGCLFCVIEFGDEFYEIDFDDKFKSVYKFKPM